MTLVIHTGCYQIQIANRELVALVVDVGDVIQFDPDLAEGIIRNTKRYTSMFADVVYLLLPEYRDETTGV